MCVCRYVWDLPVETYLSTKLPNFKALYFDVTSQSLTFYCPINYRPYALDYQQEILAIW